MCTYTWGRGPQSARSATGGRGQKCEFICVDVTTEFYSGTAAVSFMKAVQSYEYGAVAISFFLAPAYEGG